MVGNYSEDPGLVPRLTMQWLREPENVAIMAFPSDKRVEQRDDPTQRPSEAILHFSYGI